MKWWLSDRLMAAFAEETETFPGYLHGESHERETRMCFITFRNSRPGLMTKKEGGLQDEEICHVSPYLPLPSSLCPRIHLNSHLLWKRVDTTAVAPVSCVAGPSLCQIPAQEKPLVHSLSDCLDTRRGLYEAEPEATWEQRSHRRKEVVAKRRRAGWTDEHMEEKTGQLHLDSRSV